MHAQNVDVRLEWRETLLRYRWFGLLALGFVLLLLAPWPERAFWLKDVPGRTDYGWLGWGLVLSFTETALCGRVGKQLVDYFGTKYALLVSSWTGGAVATLLALSMGPGEVALLPVMTFIAMANVVQLLGARPVFVDVDPDTLVVSPDLIARAVTTRAGARQHDPGGHVRSKPFGKESGCA
jgi:hypothetical protein